MIEKLFLTVGLTLLVWMGYELILAAFGPAAPLDGVLDDFIEMTEETERWPG